MLHLANTTIVTLKAFGDFLIAYRAWRLARAKHPGIDIQLLAGEHVRPLAIALGVPNDQVIYIGGASLKDMPAAFAVGQRGLWAACRSVIDLRVALDAALPTERRLVFDSLGLREQFISGRRSRQALPAAAPNIYLAYDAYFQSGESQAASHGLGATLGRAFIVAGSRVPRKVLPREVIASAHQLLASKGIAAQVLLLEGEQVDVPPSVEVVRAPRQFATLIATLGEVDLIVSADSLPAHIGDYLGKPTFVVSPAPNPYWLPRTAFLNGAHAVFDNMSNLVLWLDRLQAQRGNHKTCEVQSASTPQAQSASVSAD